MRNAKSKSLGEAGLKPALPLHERGGAAGGSPGSALFFRATIFCGPVRRLWPELWKQDHIADGPRVREQHGKPVNAYSFAACRGQAVGERANVVLIHDVGFFVAALALPELLLEAA